LPAFAGAFFANAVIYTDAEAFLYVEEVTEAAAVVWL
jgi:hypothetical protein